MLKSLNEAIIDVVTGRDPDKEMRNDIQERISRDESNLKSVDYKSITPFQQKAIKALSDMLFKVFGPDVRKFTLHQDKRLEDDVEVHFPIPKAGITMTATDLMNLSKIKFFYIHFSKDKLIVTFI